MDARIEKLVDTHSLKMNIWKDAVRRRTIPHFYANPRLDVVMVMIVDPHTPKVTHFIDENVALLYIEESREVVGFRIEGFEKSFLPQYADLQKVWRMSDVDQQAASLGDLFITVRTHEIRMANALTNVARPILAKAGMKVPAFSV
jgi:hypothetical protein